MLGDGDEDTGWKSHVEDTVSLLLTLLELGEVLLEFVEALILVILSGDIAAHFAETLKLLLSFLGWGLDVRLDPLEVLGVVHLCARISDNLDIAREELVTVLADV